MSSIIRSALALTMAGIALGGAQSCTPKTDTGSLPVKIVVRDEPQEMVAGEDGTFHFKIPVGYIPKGGSDRFQCQCEYDASVQQVLCY